MKYKKLCTALCAALLLTGSFGVLIGCNKETTTTPPTTATEPSTNPTPPAGEDATLKEADAQAIALETLPEGYTLHPAGLIDAQGASISAEQRKEGESYYYAWDVHDAEETRVGGIAIDKESGARYSYNGGTGDAVISEYTEFPLYNAATDAICDWNGVFKNGDVSIELAQSDNSSFDFALSDGTQGTARIKGNTAATEDGALTFVFEDENTLRLGSENPALAGDYVKQPQ